MVVLLGIEIVDSIRRAVISTLELGLCFVSLCGGRLARETNLTMWVVFAPGHAEPRIKSPYHTAPRGRAGQGIESFLRGPAFSGVPVFRRHLRCPVAVSRCGAPLRYPVRGLLGYTPPRSEHYLYGGEIDLNLHNPNTS